ncbi:MAG: Ldh family oxidoreductase [Lachnospiraceae bacterium]|nr:Ldh family oxidoreductase [Lachnospiraceae bacterium]
MSYTYLPVDKARLFCEDVFEKHGFTREECERIVDVVLTADLYGIESHGIQRMIRYHNSIIRDLVHPKAKPEIVFETKLSAVIDGARTMGQTTASMAMNMAIAKAKEHGFGAVTVRNCNHYGIAGYYAKMAAAEDLLGFSSTNTEAIAIPTFGKQPMLGTSPLALCMPADPYDFLFDAATTVVPRGKIEIYNKKGLPLKDGWAADENGETCSDAQHVLDNINAKVFGGIFPIGGASVDTASHKGYGLGIIAEIFTGILSGGHTSPHVMNGGMGDTSFGFIALDYGMFGDKKEIKDRMSTLLRELRESPKAKGHDRIYTHGEKEMESTEEKMRTGIPANDKTIEELRQIGSYVGLRYEDYFA